MILRFWTETKQIILALIFSGLWHWFLKSEPQFLMDGSEDDIWPMQEYILVRFHLILEEKKNVQANNINELKI